jgi:hypothetical protein
MLLWNGAVFNIYKEIGDYEDHCLLECDAILSGITQ